MRYLVRRYTLRDPAKTALLDLFQGDSKGFPGCSRIPEVFFSSELHGKA